jgi:hypothetical protein
MAHRGGEFSRTSPCHWNHPSVPVQPLVTQATPPFRQFHHASTHVSRESSDCLWLFNWCNMERFHSSWLTAAGSCDENDLKNKPLPLEPSFGPSSAPSHPGDSPLSAVSPLTRAAGRAPLPRKAARNRWNGHRRRHRRRQGNRI